MDQYQFLITFKERKLLLSNLWLLKKLVDFTFLPAFYSEEEL